MDKLKYLCSCLVWAKLNDSFSKIDLFDALKREAGKINDLIARFLEGRPEGLYAAAKYLPSLGGKRLRPFVTVMCGRMLGAPEEPLYLSAVGVELLHNFTLVHDDIMDRDEYRRGHPTVHKVYGEAVAILAGDLLFAKAFEAASLAEKMSGSPGVVHKLVEAAIKLDQGQFLDMSFESQENVSLQQYLEMIELKTGALFEAAAVIGGILGGLRDSKTISALADYGRNLGLCFQIRDDYLGVFGDPSKTGKPVGSDIRRGKKTAVTLLAPKDVLELMKKVSNKPAEQDVLARLVESLKQEKIDLKSMELASDFAWKAISSLSIFPECAEKKLLVDLVNYSWQREN